MKKLLLVLAIFCIFVPCGAAGGNWTFGLSGSMDRTLSNSGTGIFAGAGLELGYSFNETVSLHTGINYFALSFSEFIDSLDEYGYLIGLEVYSGQYHFVQVPILAKIQMPITADKDLFAYVNLGPALDVELGYTIGSSKGSSYRYKRLGAITGIGLNYALKSPGGKIGLELRHELLLKTFDSEAGTPDSNAGIFSSNVFSIRGGFTF